MMKIKLAFLALFTFSFTLLGQSGSPQHRHYGSHHARWNWPYGISFFSHMRPKFEERAWRRHWLNYQLPYFDPRACQLIIVDDTTVYMDCMPWGAPWHAAAQRPHLRNDFLLPNTGDNFERAGPAAGRGAFVKHCFDFGCWFDGPAAGYSFNGYGTPFGAEKGDFYIPHPNPTPKKQKPPVKDAAPAPLLSPPPDSAATPAPEAGTPPPLLVDLLDQNGIHEINPEDVFSGQPGTPCFRNHDCGRQAPYCRRPLKSEFGTLGTCVDTPRTGEEPAWVDKLP